MADDIARIIDFPRILRVEKLVLPDAVPPEQGLPEPGAPDMAVVDHDGRPYVFAALMRHVDQDALTDSDASAPRSAQAAWDRIVRRFPRQAEAAAARCRS